jgi:hypothetical protein
MSDPIQQDQGQGQNNTKMWELEVGSVTATSRNLMNHSEFSSSVQQDSSSINEYENKSFDNSVDNGELLLYDDGIRTTTVTNTITTTILTQTCKRAL